jgi:transposase
MVWGTPMTCTKAQVRKLMRLRQTHSREVAAAKAGMSENTARKYVKQGGEILAAPERDYRTRRDPFREVWWELEKMLEGDSGLEAKTLMRWLLERYPDQFRPTHLRTLQRRVSHWRALHGPEKEIFFPQNLQPGKQSQSDYTNCNELGVTIAGEPFEHLLFHFMLPYSRWEAVSIAFTESFQSLTEGFEKAVNDLGGVAPEHRTDNLAAAVPIGGEKREFQRRWKDFLNHYDVEPTTNNPYQSNENGSVEKSHDLLKRGLDQRLRLRGSKDFPTREDEWIRIPVPPLITPAIFQPVQEQLAENKSKARTRKVGARYLLQGLIACKLCGHAYYGKPCVCGNEKELYYEYYRDLYAAVKVRLTALSTTSVSCSDCKSDTPPSDSLRRDPVGKSPHSG